MCMDETSNLQLAEWILNEAKQDQTSVTPKLVSVPPNIHLKKKSVCSVGVLQTHCLTVELTVVTDSMQTIRWKKQTTASWCAG